MDEERKLYCARFVDTDGSINEKLLETETLSGIVDYIESSGNKKVISIKERKNN